MFKCQQNLVEVDSEEVLANLTPNFLALSDIHAAGFIVTSSSESQEQDFVYRYFAPLVGIKEDHVTGSACRCLAAFWSKRLHKANLQAFQASSRGAAITMTLEEEKLEIQGQAISVAKVNWL